MAISQWRECEILTMDRETLRIVIQLVKDHVEHQSDRTTAGLTWPTAEQLQLTLRLATHAP